MEPKSEVSLNIAQLRSNLDVDGVAASQTQELPSWLSLGQHLNLVTVLLSKNKGRTSSLQALPHTHYRSKTITEFYSAVSRSKGVVTFQKQIPLLLFCLQRAAVPKFRPLLKVPKFLHPNQRTSTESCPSPQTAVLPFWECCSPCL